MLKRFSFSLRELCPAALFLAATAFLAALGAAPAAAQEGVEKLEGSWQIRTLGSGDRGLDFIYFGAGNSAQWFHFASADDCWTSRHHYRIKNHRMIFNPPLPDQRSWWNPDFETPARIELLERTRTEDGRSSQKIRLVRASVPNPGCKLRDPSKEEGQR